ncbi:Rpn family recombination-promoting nuclease/putative transposase [Halarsenatibacter silvermanii]|uniref:Putative transposase, YhgA-like n=1 Tax=Halarsenatibacter silvermanii TaxID=321763 RepID=A0A1G9TYL5_9FIRM|nr:Rpn family recombination-promoting nuclease/putative transposase [Halarsenatibacter silvermanii]SDM52879.1 Putative transposase, YhgA-like [Halarsenatibacter silvermanii]
MTEENNNISQEFLREIENIDPAKIKNPHDRLFKWSLGRPDIMKEYLDYILSKDLSEALNYETLEATKANYVDDLIGETFSDLVYKINKTTGEGAVISLLFEHKSSPDKITPLKLLRYITNAYFDNFKDGETKQIIPILFYHGSSEWNIPGKLSEVLDGDITPFENYTPEFEYIFTDLDEAADLLDDTTKPELKIFIEALRIANAEDIEEANERFKNCLKIFREPYWSSEILRVRFLQVFLLYQAKVSFLAQELNIFDIAKQAYPERSEEIMSLYDTIQKEERANTLIELLENKLNQPLPEDIDDKLNSADKIKLVELTNRIFEINSYDDVREILD